MVLKPYIEIKLCFWLFLFGLYLLFFIGHLFGLSFDTLRHQCSELYRAGINLGEQDDHLEKYFKLELYILNELGKSGNYKLGSLYALIAFVRQTFVALMHGFGSCIMP